MNKKEKITFWQQVIDLLHIAGAETMEGMMCPPPVIEKRKGTRNEKQI